MKRAGWWAAVAAAIASWAAPAASAQEAKLIFATVSPAGNPLNARVFVPWAQRVNEQGKGVVQIDVREGTTLANFGNVYTRVVDDVVQVGWALQDAVGGKFVLSEVGGLPFLFDKSEHGSAAFWRLYRSGALGAEYAEVVPIMLAPLGQVLVHLAKPPKSVDDLGGVKLMVGGKVHSEIAKRLGGTPISVPWSELYESLQRGTIDGAVTGWSSVAGLKLHEVVTHHLDAPLGTSVGMIFMAKKRWDALPAAARAVLEANLGEVESRRIGTHFDGTAAAARAAAKASGKQTVLELTPEQAAAWQRKLAPVLDEWAKTRPRGDKVLADFRTLLARVKAGG
jgi:TRAP-type C4-dicarboxylate transport system substrate-binding protein